MGAVTTPPSVEAMTAIRDRINSGTAYVLAVNAVYTEQLIDELEHIRELRVDVVCEAEQQLNETLAIEDRTNHPLRIWVRAPMPRQTNEEMTPLKLLVAQLFQRVNDFVSADRRCVVWDCGIEPDGQPRQVPDKMILKQNNLFVASIPLRVEVEPP